MEEQLKKVCDYLVEEFKDKLTKGTSISPTIKNEIFNSIYGVYIGDADSNSSENGETEEDFEAKIEQIKEVLSFKDDESIYCWDKNWSFRNSTKTYAHRFGEYLIYKAGEYRLVEPEEFILSDDVNTGNSTLVNLKIKQFESGEGGTSSWFWIKGKNYLSNFNLVKFYLSLDEKEFDEILKFFKAIKDELNARNIPFWIKFEKNFTKRFDNAVLYTQHNHYYLVFHAIKRYYEQHKVIFRDNNLFFTKPILKGITFAEETFKRGMSFGQVRSFEIFNAFVKYYEQEELYTKSFSKFKKQTTSSNLFEFVVRTIEKNNYKIDEFYRNPNTYYGYDFSVFNNNFTYIASRNIASTNKLVALEIGRLLCKHAVIFIENDETNCRWISADTEGYDEVNYHVIDDSFEKGRLGITYFLANLYFWFPEDWVLKEICSIVLASISENEGNKGIIAEINNLLKVPVDIPDNGNFKSFFENDKTILENLETIYDALKVSPLQLNQKQLDELQKIASEIIQSIRSRGVYSYKEDDEFVATFGDYGYALIGLALLVIPDKN